LTTRNSTTRIFESDEREGECQPYVGIEKEFNLQSGQIEKSNHLILETLSKGGKKLEGTEGTTAITSSDITVWWDCS
jgi:hypothetical protein